jgi:hypothetical protein
MCGGVEANAFWREFSSGGVLLRVLPFKEKRRKSLNSGAKATPKGQTVAPKRKSLPFDIVVKEESGRAVISWTKKAAWQNWSALSEGCYLLRTNITDWSAAEAAFRIEKSDLRIRPIWHQKEDRGLSHILVCFLAYVLWKTLGRMVKSSGLGDEPRRVLNGLSKINLVDVVLPTSASVEIRKRCITRPTEHQEILLQYLGLKIPLHWHQKIIFDANVV